MMDAELAFMVTRGMVEYQFRVSVYSRWFAPQFGWVRGMPQCHMVAAPGNMPVMCDRADFMLLRGGPFVMSFSRTHWKRWEIRGRR